MGLSGHPNCLRGAFCKAMVFMASRRCEAMEVVEVGLRSLGKTLVAGGANMNSRCRFGCLPVDLVLRQQYGAWVPEELQASCVELLHETGLARSEETVELLVVPDEFPVFFIDGASDP